MKNEQAKRRLTVARMWDSYKRSVLPDDASEAQLQGTEMAFYGGATALLSLITCQLDEGSEPTEDDYNMMNAIATELREFSEKMKAQADQISASGH